MHEGMQIATWVAWIVWNDYLARKYSSILINLVNGEERSNEWTDSFHRLGRDLMSFVGSEFRERGTNGSN